MNGIVKCSAAKGSLSNRKVALFDSGSGKSVKVAETTTDSEGRFSFSDMAADSRFYYVNTFLSAEIVFTVILGSTIPATFVINELTTVAAGYAAAQFLIGGIEIEGSPFALSIVAAMNANLVDVRSGTPSTVMTSSPNGDETNSLRTMMSLANVLRFWMNDPGAFDTILAKLAAMPNSAKPSTTIEVLAGIARNPAAFAGALYVQSKEVEFYQPALEQQPVAWTIVVKVNDSGSDDNMFGGPASVAFDDQGRAWIPNNVQQGTGASSAYCIVLDMSGRPASKTNGALLSPFTGGGLLGAGFGANIDSKGNAWFGDFGWGGVNPVGSVSLFDPNAVAISPSPNGYTLGGVNRVQGTVADGEDNIWLAGYGSNSVVVYRAGIPPVSYAAYQGDASFVPFDIAVAGGGVAWVTNSNSDASGIMRLQLGSSSSLAHGEQINIGRTNKGIVIDSSGNIWVASGGDDHIYLFDSGGNLLGGFQGGGLDGPWGIALDGDDNLWVANFGPLEIGSVFEGRLTQLAGVNATGHRLGDGLTPQTGYPLPSAGAQVLLHNGDPLYGAGKPPSYIPMMRTTGVSIDAAGNVWSCNNWKPSFDNDAIGGAAANPGGDGILIWVGLAKPVQR